jgi:hypothetical protein
MPARIRLIAVGAVAVVLGVWWAYPSAAREPTRLDVLIVGDGQVGEAAEPLVRRVRELGMTVELITTDACTASGEVGTVTEDRPPSIVVLSPSAPSGCGAPFWFGADAAVGDARLVALVQPGRTDATARADLAAAGVEVADATVLLGERSLDVAPPERMACQWWDDCDPDGQVAVRDGAGALTYAGGERLARTLAGVLP